MRIVICLLLGVFCSLGHVENARAQSYAWGSGVSHVVIPQSRTVGLRGNDDQVSVAAVSAVVTILERTATTTLQLEIQNRGGTAAESVILLPVPDGAVVGSFLFAGAASEPTAELLPKERAREVYDAIVAKARDPALLEFAGYNLIRSSVFPVPAQGQQTVRLTYEHLLTGDGARTDFLLPRSESLAMRQAWNIGVDVKSRRPISMVYSPSHDITTTRHSAHHISLRVKDSATREPGAFRLSYLIEEGDWSASLLAYPDPSIGGGYFLLMAGAPPLAEDQARRKREITVVLDRSGSMAGKKLDQAKAAARQVIEGLADGEFFNIVDYSTSVSMFSPKPIARDRESILAARAYIDAIRPSGGTNIHDALLEALRQPTAEGALPMVLFLTDGLPTIGKTSEVLIRDLVEQSNTRRRRIFTFGVGDDVNVPLLDRLADTSRGVATYILPDEDVELKVAQVFRRLYGPVLSDLKLATRNRDGSESTRRVAELMPNRIPDLFDGDQLLLLGQYKGEEPLRFLLSGDAGNTKKDYAFEFDLSVASTRNSFVARLWASRRIAFLIDQVRQSGASAAQIPQVVNGYGGSAAGVVGEGNELVDEIMRLSTEFGILTEYTAFLARDGTDLNEWSDLLVGCNLLLNERAVQTRAGRGAVSQGVNFNAQKSQRTLNYSNGFYDRNLARVEISNVQQVCDRAFFQNEGRWVDSRLVKERASTTPTRTIVFGSPEHTKLLDQLIREGRQGLLSMTGAIVLEHDGEVVLIEPTSSAESEVDHK